MKDSGMQSVNVVWQLLARYRGAKPFSAMNVSVAILNLTWNKFQNEGSLNLTAFVYSASAICSVTALV